MSKKQVSVTGVVTYWSCAATRLQALRASLANVDAGLDAYLPKLSTPLNALRQALEECFPGKLIRRLKGVGFAIVDESKGETSNGYTDDGSVYFDCDDDAGEDSADLRFRGIDPAKATEVRNAYTGSRGILEPGTVGNILSRIVVEFLGGTILRPTGGIYWLSDDRAAKWDAIAEAVNNAGTRVRGSTIVYRLSHEMDEHAVRAVTDAIVNELSAEAARLNEQVMSGDLKERALKSREREAIAAIEKATRYEQLLNVPLTNVRKSLDTVKDAAAAAALQLSIVDECDDESKASDAA